jgi:hypothetical protein
MSTITVDCEPLSREIRVFLSSTFQDMDAERSHLIKQVFPKVRAVCMARQVGFTEIDLRWGVTEEQSKNGATVEICLREIERCRDFPPFFIGFLGERYGWIPQHVDLATYWDKHVDTEHECTIRHAVERNISVTELEMEVAVLAHGAADKLHGQALFLLRDPTFTDTLYQNDTGKAPNRNDLHYYDAGEGKLPALKAQIRATPYLSVDGYTSIEQFGEAIENYLLAQLDRLFPLADVPSPLERQRAAHATFRFHRLQKFLPRLDVRSELIAVLERHVAETQLGPILLAGPSGQGKSALLADLAQHIETARPDWLILDHYTGADDANHLESWARRILETLHPRISHLVEGIPETPKDQKAALSSWIAMVCRKSEQDAQLPAGSTKLILILDAIDQNSDGGKQLDLLNPEVLGPDAVVVTSAADGTPARNAASTFETILVPPLTDVLKVQMVTDTLVRFNKELPPELAKRLAGAKQSGSPLFLGLALEELRLDGRHEDLEPLVGKILSTQSAQELFLMHFLLDSDNGRRELPTLAAAFMALLGASRSGLTELELADLLANPEDPIAIETNKPRLPQVHLSRLLTNLAPFLINKDGRRAPMHRIFGEVAVDYYGTIPVREHLYDYFKTGYGAASVRFDTRAATEALFQATKMAVYDRVQRKRLLTDLGRLKLLARLHRKSEQDVFDALQVFGIKTKTHLGNIWADRVAKWSVEDFERFGQAAGHFAAWIGKRVGHYPAARVLQTAILDANNLLRGDEHPYSHAAMTNLASTLRIQGDLDEALILEKLVFERRLKDLGEDDPSTLTSMIGLARTHFKRLDYEKAQRLQEMVLETRRSLFGEHHKATLVAMNDLAKTYRSQKNTDAAMVMQEHVFETLNRNLGRRHVDTLTVMHALALTFRAKGFRKKARKLLEEVFEVRKMTLGKRHPATLSTMGELVKTLQKMLKVVEPDSSKIHDAQNLRSKINNLRQNVIQGTE